MRLVDVRVRQLQSHGGDLYAVDIRGNIWIKDAAAPQGWRKVGMPRLEIEPHAEPTQIPAVLQDTRAPMPRVVHFQKTPEREKRTHQSARGWHQGF